MAVKAYCLKSFPRPCFQHLWDCVAFSLQYSGFQQTAEKCAVCGHLIMEMVSISVNWSVTPTHTRRKTRLVFAMLDNLAKTSLVN